VLVPPNLYIHTYILITDIFVLVIILYVIMKKHTTNVVFLFIIK